jgi:hypothetical protein
MLLGEFISVFRNNHTNTVVQCGRNPVLLVLTRKFSVLLVLTRKKFSIVSVNQKKFSILSVNQFDRYTKH